MVRKVKQGALPFMDSSSTLHATRGMFNNPKIQAKIKAMKEARKK